MKTTCRENHFMAGRLRKANETYQLACTGDTGRDSNSMKGVGLQSSHRTFDISCNENNFIMRGIKGPKRTSCEVDSPRHTLLVTTKRTIIKSKSKI